MSKNPRILTMPTSFRTGLTKGPRSVLAIVVAISMALFVFAVLLGRSAAVVAADDAAVEKAAPTAFVMLPGSDELLADAHYLLDLTTPAEKKQWPVLKDYFSVFLFGVDAKQPTRVGVVFGQKADRYVWSVPIANFPKFKRDTIGQILTPHIKQIEPNVFRLGNGRQTDFNGFLLYTPPYVRLGESRTDLTSLPADPRPEMESLASRNYMAAIELENKETDAASQSKRHELFQVTRKQSLNGLKKDKSEKPEDFELRKKALEIQLGETEWLFAESQKAHLGLAVDCRNEPGSIH